MPLIELNGSVNISLRYTDKESPGGVNSKFTQTNIAKLFQSTSASMLKEVSGQYIANNDYITILSSPSLSVTSQATFLVVVADNPVGLYIGSNTQQVMSSIVINGFALLSLKHFSPSNQSSIILDSRAGITTAPVPVGTVINYYAAVLDDLNFSI